MSGLLGAKPIAASSPMLGPLRVQTSTQAVAVPIVYGTTRVNCNVIWYNDLQSNSLAEAVAGALTGKGGLGGSVKAAGTPTYSTAVALGICEGPISGIGQVWASKTSGTAATYNFTVYTGAAGQAPFGYIATYHPDQALAYAGTAYVVTGNYYLGTATDLPTHSFEVQGIYCNAVTGSADANPALVLADFLTNPVYGAGIAAAQLGDFTQFSNYCLATGLLFSPVFDAQQAAQAWLTNLLQLANAALVWSAGTLKIIPYGDTPITGNGVSFAPNLTPVFSLTDDDFLEQPDGPVTLSRSAAADLSNHVMLEFLHRANQYNVAVIDVKDQASIGQVGLLPATPIQAHAICDINVAALVAQLILQRQVYSRNTYQFRLGWRYCTLEPMDIVAITDVALGLNAAPVRILSVEEDAQGTLTLTAENLNPGIAAPNLYVKQGAVVLADAAGANVDPGTVTYPT
jgi:hypothetical protein